MFMGEDRLPVVREMILAREEDERRAALEKLLPMQQADFEGIFEAMAWSAVTIRLLDPPLHEFLPPLEEAPRTRCATGSANYGSRTRCSERVDAAWACSSPEIYEMQVRAVVRAARVVRERTGGRRSWKSCIRSSASPRSSRGSVS